MTAVNMAAEGGHVDVDQTSNPHLEGIGGGMHEE